MKISVNEIKKGNNKKEYKNIKKNKKNKDNLLNLNK